MRLLLSILVTALFAMSATAQHFNFYPSQHMTDTVEANETSMQFMKIVPSDSQDVQVKWVTVTNTLDTAWSVSLCDYPACYFFIPDSGTMAPVTTPELQSGTTPFFQLLVETNETVGSAEVSIYVYDANQPTVRDTVTFVIVNTEASDITGLENAATSNTVKVFPNPVQEVVSIEGAALEEVHLYHMSGTLIESRTVTGQSRMQLDVSELTPGFYVIVTRQGETVTRTKLLKQ